MGGGVGGAEMRSIDGWVLKFCHKEGEGGWGQRNGMRWNDDVGC